MRDVVRFKQKLTDEENIQILKETKRGVLSVIGDEGYPYGVPINHYYHTDGCIYFHSGKTGHKIDAINNNDKATFCVYTEDKQVDWYKVFKSVIVFGKIELINDYDITIEISRLLSYKFTSDDNYIDDEIRKSGKGTQLIKLTPIHITGKRVNEN